MDIATRMVYVSFERVQHRFLQGQAVSLFGNQGPCIIAKSYEMKARGVNTGMPIWVDDIYHDVANSYAVCEVYGKTYF